MKGNCNLRIHADSILLVEELVVQAMRLTGLRTKRGLIDYALIELVRCRQRRCSGATRADQVGGTSAAQGRIRALILVSDCLAETLRTVPAHVLQEATCFGCASLPPKTVSTGHTKMGSSCLVFSL